MKTFQPLSRRFEYAAVIAAGLVMVSATGAHAVTKNWTGASGNWSPGNWSPAGVPGPDDLVNIVNSDGTARTVTLNVNTASLGLVSIGLTGAGTAANTLSMTTGNNLTALGIFVGGYSGTGPTNGRGAITQNAGTATARVGSDWVLGHGAGSTGTYNLSLTGQVIANQSLFIGLSGTGVFNQSGGTTTINDSPVGSLNIAANAGSTGTYNLSGGLLASNKSGYVGDNGTGIFNHTGGQNTTQDLYIGNGASGIGTYTFSGGTLFADNVFVGNAGTGTLTIQGTAVAFIDGLSINGSSAVNMNGGTLDIGTIPLSSIPRFNFNGGKIRLSGDRNIILDELASLLFFFPGISGPRHGEIDGIATIEGGTSLAILEITDGGIFTSHQGRIGVSSGTHGIVNVTGPGSAWFLTSVGFLHVGGLGSNAELNIRNGGLVHGNINVVVDTNGVVNLDGGILRCFGINEFGGNGVFNFYSGTLQLAGDRTFGDDDTITKVFGSAPTLTSGKELAIEGTATLLTAVTLDGGTFTAPTIVNGQHLSLQRGRLNITNQAVTIAVGGLLGSTLDLNDDMTVNINAGITNQGLVTGDGQIGGTFTNAASGELRGEPGKSLKLTGGALAATNSGRITLYGGMIEFTQNLFNNAGGFISGNGTLKTNTLNNSGTMNFAGTANILGTVTNNAGGKVISGGGGATIFYGDVTNNGEIRTSTNGFTVFFGSVSGSGTFTGTGTVNFEGDLSPGSSPASVTFAGDVVLGAAASLQIEIGGLAAGTQHDKLTVAGDLSLDGALDVSLINGFNPSAGQSFNILDWGSLAGTFSSLNLPTLSGLAWDTSQLYTTGVLGVAAAPNLPGDFNLNGAVDAADYVVWRNGLGTTHTQNDYNLWRAHFGQTAGTGSSLSSAEPLSTAVPEPATIALLLLANATSLVIARRGRLAKNRC